jgi:hypothetical protein
VVWLVALADLFDGAEGPVHCCDLDEGGPDACDHLGCEGYSRWELHVVTWLLLECVKRGEEWGL